MARRARWMAYLTLLVACSKPVTSDLGASRHDAQRTPDERAASAAPASPPAPEHHPSARARAACRALAVEGNSVVNGVPVAVGTLLDGEQWVDLARGASLSLRHTQTSREFKLIGPGRILPCRDGSEQILVSAGQLQTSANLGVRPGAEVLIATPVGTVRYGDAALSLEFGPRGLKLRVDQGEAWLEPVREPKTPIGNPLRGGAQARLPGQALLPAELAKECETAAGVARDSARSVLDGAGFGPSLSLGVRAAANMRARQQARRACAIARAALGKPGHSAEMQALSDSVGHSDELWQSVPRP